MTTKIDVLIIVGFVISGLSCIGFGVAGIYYDPDIDIGAGRKMPRSLAKKIDMMWFQGPDGPVEWHNPVKDR